MNNHKGQSDQDPLSLANFISFPYQNFQGAPVTQFTAGSPLSLRWDSNGTKFNLYANGDPHPLYTGPTASADLRQGFQTNTTLMLVADNGSDKIYAFLTIIISNPALTPETIWHDTGNMTNTGTLSVEGSLYNTTLTFGSTGILNLGDNASFADLIVSQTSNVSGATSGNNLQVPTSNIKNFTVTHNLVATDATIAMIGKGHVLWIGGSFGEMDITAQTDGFVFVTVDPNGCGTNVSAACTITYGDQQYTVSGKVLKEDSTLDAPQSGYCCIPLQNSRTLSFSGTATYEEGTTPLISVFWVPLGGGDNTYTISAGNTQLAATSPPATIPDRRVLSAQMYTDLLQTLAAAMQKNPAPATALAQKLSGL